ncbi:DUF4234 domain-containing protein [Falsibacillus albus]|uniref:DUF4234 domain-containing protein n=1 Tax=Falsibacillus albus TaxID=2478915 RepID=A0A3L7JKA6_9BACI|nr:DUF4234 domain-containing protein [Falsibacillus albus]RLQ91156.1 hypothetical protein D9X91_20925 [Falsibacillus albus]
MEAALKEQGYIQFKKSNVALVVFLTFITLGIYLGYWFLNRKSTFNGIHQKNHIPFKWWWLFTIYLVLSFLFNFIGSAFLTPYGLSFFNSIDTIISFYFLGILYFSVFRVKDLIEEETNEGVFKPWMLVLFHVWYLQYKMNRLEGIGRDSHAA